MPIYSRGFDLAASINKTSDYTASVLICKTDNGIYIIEDYFRYRLDPAGVEKLILKTVKTDGIKVKQTLPIDPGQAGPSQKLNFSRMLAGYNFSFVRETKSKFERAKAVSSQVLSGNFRIIKNQFYNEFMDEIEEFGPEPKKYQHDDFVDSLSTAFNSLLDTYPSARLNPLPFDEDEIGFKRRM